MEWLLRDLNNTELRERADQIEYVHGASLINFEDGNKILRHPKHQNTNSRLKKKSVLITCITTPNKTLSYLLDLPI